MSARIDAEAHAAVRLLRDAGADRYVHRRHELLALGITDALQTAMVRRSLLTRLRHGVYALTDVVLAANPVDRHLIDLAACVASAREPAWSFGPSAALVRQMPLPYSVPDTLFIVRSSGGDERALHRPSQHRLTIPEADVTTGPINGDDCSVIRGIPVVGPALAGVSAAASMTSSRWRTALLDAALWQGATAEEIAQVLDQWRHLGHREALLAALDRARPGAQTIFETFSRLSLIEQGIPEPVLQQPFYDEDGLIGYVDMWWPDWNVIGEADGAVKYQARADVVAEKRREDRLRRRGPSVVRWMFDEIEEHPEQVAARIRQARRRAA